MHTHHLEASVPMRLTCVLHSGNLRPQHLRVVLRVHGVSPAVPVCEVEREVLGGEAVVPIVVLHGVERGRAVAGAVHGEGEEASDGGDEGGKLVASVAGC